MLAIERQRRILAKAKKNGTVRTQELASMLEVTEETVRRDLDALSRRGQLKRTHGGAADVSVILDELPADERETRQAAEKAAIAKMAMKHVGENETIMLDASSTALEFARHLPAGKSLKVATYSHDIIERLSMRRDIELVLLGGIYEPKGRRFTGLITEMGIRSLRIDRFFFSGSGFEPVRGIGEPNPEEARTKSLIISLAAWKCAMIDQTKLGRVTDNYFAKPADIDVLITDKEGAAFCKTPAMKKMVCEFG
ncbi:MAG: DeoR/GlpR family DNA-binding transcription regulator [Akkermansiaceae bacterium]|nr:DeoR/GlpR family DNA-binding transcription regulator [Akkermansiaceae bacterium]MDP4646878.1 DeoR/GlpR family DNA-binding transcription regulator [Akkermansiaceae bacterium]MDP4721538.1 DeoR/GlpR family DNA-binding transcription regulator [Akkermansiaceae bacterium]MDP4781209.1 DeoR/GlpR family DNA-binding transcription regulator [Akkermansiaceae bacterium]MDP4847915.1 DeoR/GlpR family DNA-binding transcription regulator [Akkermansiaceae bacterium]